MNFTHLVWVKISSLALPQIKHNRDEGAGFVEYGAILVFVSLVALVVINAGIGNRIAQGITSVIDEVFSRSP